jgi:hypothetical protein
MQYVLVLQWPASSQSDFEALIEIEDALEAGIAEDHGFVDGHDFGSGEMNIFVHTDVPLEAFRDAQASLSGDLRWAGVRAAYRDVDGDQYQVVWPAGLQEFSVS